MSIFKKNLPVIGIGLFCLLLISIWFKDGKLLATGEEGLMLVNPSRNIELYRYSWNEVGLGNAVPGSNTMLPFFYLESFAINLGIPVWIFQAATFFILMLVGSLSIYYLSKELFKNLVRTDNLQRIALLSAIFYILNPVSMLGVWYRFVLSFMFFYSQAPVFFYLYVWGLNHNKKSFVVIVPLVSLLFSFAFSNPSSILTLWFLPFVYTLVLSFSNHLKNKRRLKIFPLLYLCFSLIYWALINLWWIIPYKELSVIAFSSETSLEHAVGTLKANSADFTLTNVIRLIHGGFLYRNEAFGNIYKTPLFLIFSWCIPIITIYGLLKMKSGQIKLFFILSLFLLLFLVKGSSPPLGGIFIWFFSTFSFLQAYRNPMEKIGMLLPIIYAPLFSFGLFYYLNKFRHLKRIIVLLVVLVCLMVFNWPFFSGAFTSFRNRDIRVVVPSSFKNANKAIPQGNHLILSIPVMGGASGFYKWQFGYKGDEGSSLLFDYPVINKFYNATSFSGQMLVGFSNGPLNNLIGLAQLFSADIIAYRKDTDVAAFGYNLDALERSQKMIAQSNLTKIFDSPEVSLWTLPKDLVVPVIYTPREIKFGQSPQDLISLLENNKYDAMSETFICINKDKCNPFISQEIQQIKIEAIPEKIEFKKESPVQYNIKVFNSRGNFLLVFNDAYHPGWKISINGKSINNDQHIVANGYSNGFIVDRKGSFDILLKFEPEESLIASYKSSFIAVGLGILFLIGLAVVYRFKKNYE